MCEVIDIFLNVKVVSYISDKKKVSFWAMFALG